MRITFNDEIAKAIDIRTIITPKEVWEINFKCFRKILVFKTKEIKIEMSKEELILMINKII